MKKVVRCAEQHRTLQSYYTSFVEKCQHRGVKNMYEYRCVPAPMRLIVKNEKDMENAVRGFSDIINENANYGWEFCSMEEIIYNRSSRDKSVEIEIF